MALISPSVLQLAQMKDSRWLTLEVCREFQRNKCTRTASDCKYAHPPAHVEVHNGRVVCCYDSIKGKCSRNDPPCKYLHPPQHLKEQLVQNGRQNLIVKNIQMQLLSQNLAAGGQQIFPFPQTYIGSSSLQPITATSTSATAAAAAAAAAAYNGSFVNAGGLPVLAAAAATDGAAALPQPAATVTQPAAAAADAAAADAAAVAGGAGDEDASGSLAAAKFRQNAQAAADACMRLQPAGGKRQAMVDFSGKAATVMQLHYPAAAIYQQSLQPMQAAMHSNHANAQLQSQIYAQLHSHFHPNYSPNYHAHYHNNYQAAYHPTYLHHTGAYMQTLNTGDLFPDAATCATTLTWV